MAQKKALLTGITGQDGSYLAEFLLEKGYEVHGIIRRSSSFNTDRIEHIFQDPHTVNQKLFLHYGDLSDSSNLSRLIEEIQPDEIYNLGAQSHVKISFDIPEYSGDVNALGTLRLLDAIRDSGVKTKFYQASTSEMFGGLDYNRPVKGYNEDSVFHPRSPYGVAKLYGHWITVNYRESYGLFACCGILFNHESPRRGETFVTRKITRGFSRIKLGLDKTVYLGNLDAKRDWGYAKDYVEAMWMMLQQDKPEDYVIATGETHTVRELVEHSARALGWNIKWRGSGIEEEGYDEKSGQTLIRIDEKYFRPAEVDLLLGDSTKAKKVLGWKPNVTFKELVEIMVKADYENEKKKEGIK